MIPLRLKKIRSGRVLKRLEHLSLHVESPGLVPLIGTPKHHIKRKNYFSTQKSLEATI